MLLSAPLLPRAWFTFLWSSQPWDFCPLYTKQAKCLKIPLGEVLGALAHNGVDGLGGDLAGWIGGVGGVRFLTQSDRHHWVQRQKEQNKDTAPQLPRRETHLHEVVPVPVLGAGQGKHFTRGYLAIEEPVAAAVNPTGRKKIAFPI
ncbi:hypothetical protein BDV93DRAFT_510678 [Ceratobasidium sp. AG-I]|nr:hypothetical protein BDV93DRAFT_510678 [Ceratobasidium sp. AG-I]